MRDFLSMISSIDNKCLQLNLSCDRRVGSIECDADIGAMVIKPYLRRKKEEVGNVKIFE